jgi:hypothetical protein
MYSFLMSPEIVSAKVKPAESYDWFVYTNRSPVTINANLKIEKGAHFGVCRSDDDPRKVRLVLHGNLARVWTVSMEKARALAKGVKDERH